MRRSKIELDALVQQVSELNAQGKCSREIAAETSVPQKYIQSICKRHGIKPCFPQGGPSSDKNGNYKGGRIVDKHGYIYRKVYDHPFANRSGYVFEHRLVMEKVLGRWLLPTEVVHHLDGDKQNNTPENLELYASNAEHLRVELTGKCPKWTPEGYARMLESAGRKKNR